MSGELRLALDPRKEPGTEEVDDQGRRVRIVAADEYFRRLLGSRMSATMVFLMAHNSGWVPEDQLAVVDDAIADEFWTRYEGCLVPPRVLALLRKVSAGDAGQVLIQTVESVRTELFSMESLDEAVRLHVQARVRFVQDGSAQRLTDTQVAAGEFMSDYLLLQRAIYDDIQRAEKQKAGGQTRGALLEEWDRQVKLKFDKAVAHVLRPKGGRELIPERDLALLQQYARRRPPIYQEGLLASLGIG